VFLPPLIFYATSTGRGFYEIGTWPTENNTAIFADIFLFAGLLTSE